MTSHGSHADGPCAEPVPVLLRVAIALLLALVAITSSAQRPGSLEAPTDLSKDGVQAAARRQPVVILFSLPGCHYCDVVRTHYLVPLVRDLPVREQPVIREVQVNGRASFTGFDGVRITHSALAAKYGVRFAPTVVFLDKTGTLLTAPMIGGDTAGLYGGYLDNAFAAASRILNEGQRPHTKGD